MMISKWWAAVALGIGLMAAPRWVRPASACSIPPPPGPLEELTATRDGVVSIGPPHVSAEGTYRIDVTDGDGVPVPGTVEQVQDHVVWRPATPLAPGGVYRGELSTRVSDGASEELWPFTLAIVDADAPPLAPLTVTRLDAAEHVEVTEQICCDEAIDTCGRPAFSHCWAQAYDYPVILSVRWDVTPEIARGVVLPSIIRAEGASSSWSSFVGATIRYPGAAARYCVDLETRDLIHGTTDVTEVCTTELIAEPRGGPESPDLAQCAAAPVDPRTGEVVAERDAGCAAGRDGSMVVAPAVLLLAFLGRRRRATASLPRAW